MAYTGHTWQVNEAITRGKMNSIEQGIVDASSLSETNFRSINQINTKVGDGLSSGSNLTSKVSELESAVKNLSDQNINGLISEIQASHSSKLPSNLSGTSQTFSSLGYHLDSLDDYANEVVKARKGYTDLDARLNGYDSLQTNLNNVASTANNAWDQIYAAEQGYQNLDDRLDTIDANIQTVTSVHIPNAITTALNSRIGTLGTAPDNTFSSVADYIGFDNGHTYTVKQYIDNVIGSVGTAGNAVTYVNNLISSTTATLHLDEINDAHRSNVTNDTLKQRFEAIEKVLGATTTTSSLNALSEQVAALESNITFITDNINQATINNSHTFSNLDERFDSIDAALGELSNATSTTVISESAFETLRQGNGEANLNYIVGPDTNGKYYYYKWINDDAEDKWKLISGGAGEGGGNGTSSAIIAAELPAASNADENIDYYIGNNNDGYVHYRYIPSETTGQDGTFITVLPKKITDNIDNILNHATVSTVTTTSSYSDNEAWPSDTTITGGPAIYNTNDTNHTNNLFNDFIAVRNARVNAVYDGEVLQSQTLQVLDTKGHLIEYPIVGGGGGSAYSIRFLSTMSNNIFTVPQDSSYRTIVTAKPIVKQGNDLLNGVSFSGEILYRLNSESEEVWHKSNLVLPAIQNNTEFSVDVSSILASNTTTKIRIALTINTGDGEPVERFVEYTITKTQISISSTFNPATILTSANLVIHYTCMGAGLQKQVHFKIDDVDVFAQPIIVNTHNEELQTSIPLLGLTNGSHTLQIYFETAGGVTSNKLNYYIMYSTDASSNVPIVGLNAANDNIIYGEELIVNYTAYTPGKEDTEKVEIKLYTKDENDEWILYNNHTDTRTEVPVEFSTWKTTTYPMPITPEQDQPEQPVEVRINIKAYNTVITTDANEEQVSTVYTSEETTYVTINRFTNPNNYDFSEVAPNNLLFSYSAYGKSNNDADKASYEYTYIANDTLATPLTFHGTFTDFNWATNGYMDDGSLLINGEAKYSIDVPIFQSSYNGTTIESSTANDITEFGRTIEIDYEVRSATDLNATIIQYKEEDVEGEPKKPGIVITPSYCYLTNKTTPAEIDEKDGFILNESSIAAAYLQTNTRIHLVFVIEPWSNEKAFDKKYHQSVNIYINGEYANSCPYERDNEGRIIDDFTSNGILTLGSDTCILKVYNIKMYNRGLTRSQVLQLYKLSSNLLYDRLTRFEDNDIFENGIVSYEKAKRRYNCLLLKGPDPTAQETLDYPTISPFKGAPSPAKRKKKASATDYDGKTESGLIFTKPSSDPTKDGFVEEFNLCDKVPVGAPAYLGQAGAYCSSNNVQGTSSQKYPLHNLKVYLAKWQDEKTTTKEVELEQGEDTTGLEIVEHDGVQYKVVTETTPAQIKKVKYSLKGYNDDADHTPKGTEESTFCWKADYMSTDHANTYNANIADALFTNEASDGWNPKWDEKHLQNTVYGIRCLLFQQQGDNATPVFVGDGCLNNDKGNTKTYGLEDDNDDGNDTLHQKWEFTNNTSPLDVFKSDNLFGINETDSKRQIFAKGAFECNYPDEGDLKDAGLEPNYNHLQLLLTWVNKRACYLDYSVYDENTDQTTYFTVSDTPGSGGTYNGITYDTERELKKAIFKNEFEDHFIKSHVLTYYLFSEYVALCDNRAKNMFMRSEDIRSEVIYNTRGQKILNGNEYPDDGTLWSQFVADSGNNAGITNPSVINWNTSGENHSTFARWAPVLYDLDSCFGVENVGLITIKYNADWQYQYNNKEAFSGFDSIFWLMVEDTYGSELRALATQLYNNELNFTNFYRQQIAGNLSATCPALTNEDMILKYQQPWNEGFINYGKDPDPVTGEYPKETPEYKYIQRGTRTTQKTTFMRQRSMLLSSKYVSNEFTNNMISFRAGKLVTGNDTLLTLVANQDLYPAIMFGDSNTLVRPSYIIQDNASVAIDGTSDIVPAGTYCKITTSQIGNSDTVKIVGASVLNDIGDLSKYHPYELKVGSGTNLKRLIIGSDANGYVNDSTQTIEGLSDCALLEEINVRNLTKMSSLNLGGNGLIKKVYAKGSNITTISVPNGGVLEEIEYGAKTTNITLLNQSFFTTFTFENLNPSEPNTYPNLTKLWIENTPNVPIADIIKNRLGGLVNGLRLVGINLALGNDTTILEMLATEELVMGKRINGNGSLDTAGIPYITGTITVNDLRESVWNKLNELYPSLTVTVANPLIKEYSLTFKNVDANNNQTELVTIYKTSNDTFPDPILDTNPITNKTYIQSAPANQIALNAKGLWVPIKDEDEGHVYYVGTYNSSNEYKRYSGWQIISDGTNATPTSGTIINKNMTLIAVYPTTVLKKYRVRWYDDTNTVIQMSDELEYGTDASSLIQPNKENGMIVKKYSSSAQKYKVFKGWDRPVGKINGNIDIHSLWYESNGVDSITDINDLNPADLYALTLKNGDQRKTLLDDILGRNVKYIQMGRDFEYDPNYIITHNLMPANTNALYLNSGDPPTRLIFNGQNNQEAIYPLSNLNNSFTLAIDFKFLMDEDLWNLGASEYVLFSCYRNLNGASNGFKVSIVKSSSGSTRDLPPIRVFWGNQQVDIDHSLFIRPRADQAIESYNNYRNMLVLRHNGNEPSKLYVYYHAPDTTNKPEIYNTNGITSTVLTWNSSVNVEMPLILGGNYTTEGTIESDIRYPATGIIYYAKYWEDDIGDSNAIELASWPHETVGFKICGYDNGDNGSGGRLIVGSTNNINFSAVQTIGDKYCYYKKQGYGAGYAFDGNDITDQLNCTFGWHNSDIHKYINKTIYDAFPVAYQSIIVKTNLNSVAQSRDAGAISSVTVNSNDYIYLPAYYELDKTLSLGSIYRNEAKRTWSWLNTGTLPYVYKIQNNNIFGNQSIDNLNSFRTQFFRVPVTENSRIFIMNENPCTTTKFLNGTTRLIVQRGDIWFDTTNNSTNPPAYIYVTQEDIDNGCPIDTNISVGANYTGGWSAAAIYGLRTFNTEDYRNNALVLSAFMSVSNDGTIDTQTHTGSADAYAQRALVPQFSI